MGYSLTGTPGSITSLEATTGARFIHFSWTPPHTLDITNREPDLWYTVEVRNVGGVSSNSIQYVTYEPQFNISVPNVDDCPHYEFSIAAENSAGKGNWSDAVIKYTIASKYEGYMIVDNVAELLCIHDSD